MLVYNKVSAFSFTALCVQESSPCSPMHSGVCIMRSHVPGSIRYVMVFCLSDQCEFSQLFREFAVIWQILLTFVDY